MDDTISLEQRYLAPTYKRAPMVLAGGSGVTLRDADGRTYLDFLAGIAVNVLGYADAEVVSVLREHADGLIHVSNLFHSAPHAELARDLCEASFADRVFFCNSGTEANEAAIKFARKKGGAGRAEVVAFSSAFHGRTMGALAVTHNAKYREPFEPLMGGVRWAQFDDLGSAAAVIGPTTAAVIVEPVQGEGGVKPASVDFLRGLRRLCDEAGAVLIFDEVQCGLGRTGTLWAHEPYNVAPDVMTLAKPLGGGLPIGAVLMTDAVASCLAPGDHGSTFAAGPLVTRVARTVLGRVRGMLDQVRDVGAYMGSRLSEMRSLAIVTDVRGLGLMWGVQLDASVVAGDVVTAAYQHGLIIGSAGDNTLRLVPPLIVQRADVDEMVTRLSAALESVEVAACR